MIELTINGAPVSVENGTSVLEAARGVGVDIPTLCHRDGCEVFTSCMVCVVKDLDSGKLVTACSTPAAPGMRIDTDDAEANASRREALELLLSEHVGDCEAPCRMICPAFMNIPLMIRRVRDEDLESSRANQALTVIRERIAFPSITGRICHAPCEKGCRRKRRDEAVSIRELERLTADWDLNSNDPSLPEMAPSNGRRVAIVGAGPTGLAAAYHLVVAGYNCVIFDRNANAGGMLRCDALSEQGLDPVLDLETERLKRMGVSFRFDVTIGADGDDTILGLKDRHDAVVVAVGVVDPSAAKDAFGLALEEKGFKIDYETFACDLEGVFAGGDAVVPLRQSIRAMADGKSIADSIDRFLSGRPAAPRKSHAYNHRFGRMLDGDMDEFMKEALDAPRSPTIDGSLTVAEAKTEAGRCLHCDCRGATNCELREHATHYDAKQNAYAGKVRSPFKKNDSHPDVVFEPGKCVKCGLCVRVSAKYSDAPGLAFQGRGFDTEIVVPFLESLSTGLRLAAEECVAACPTGALAWKNV